MINRGEIPINLPAMITIKSFTFNPFEENTYLLIGENRECIIVDPGFYADEEAEQFFSFIKAQNLIPTHLINTHCHLDHMFGVGDVQERYDLPLRIHKLEKPILDNVEAIANMYNLRMRKPVGKVDFISVDDRVLLDGQEFTILFTPGHSPGSICLYIGSQKALICGDVLFHGSIGRTDLPLGDFDTLIDSIRNQIFPLGEDVQVYSGHGPATSVGFEMKHNPFL
jgi:hydroxyacylglutathione hydrolase